jgi:purine-binding chemotaxis protein CheW
MQHHDSSYLLEFTLDGLPYALELSRVERVLAVCEITPLPGAPEVVCGAINWGGRLVPIFNLRQRFNLPPRELVLEDRLIIAACRGRLVGLLVDEVAGVTPCPSEDWIPMAEIASATYLAGVKKTSSGMILIQDLERFLGIEEETALRAALSDHD